MGDVNRNINIYLNEADVAASLAKMQGQAAGLEEQMKKAATPEEFAKLDKQLQATNGKIDILGKQLKGEINPSMRQMEAAITKTRNELKNMAVGTEEFNNKAKQLKEAEENLKKVRAEASGVSTALTETGKTSGGIFSGFVNGAKSAASSLPGIGSALSAMMGPVGLVIGVLAGLFKILMQNAEFADKFSFAMAGVQKVVRTVADDLMGFIKGGLSKLGEALSNPKQALLDFGKIIVEQITNRFAALGLIITAVANRDMKGLVDGFAQLGTGVTDVTGKVGAYISKQADAFESGSKSAEMLDKMGLAQARLRNSIELTNIAIEKNTTTMKDATKSDGERLAAAKEVVKLEEINANRRIQIIDIEMKAFQERNKGIELSGEEEVQIETLRVEKIQALVAKEAAIRKAGNEANLLESKRANELMKADVLPGMTENAVKSVNVVSAAVSKVKEETVKSAGHFVDAFDEAAQKSMAGFKGFMSEYGGTISSGMNAIQGIVSGVLEINNNKAEAELAKEAKNNDEKKKMLKRQLDAKKITQEQYNHEVLLLDAALNQKQRELKKKAFEADRTAKIISAVMNTAGAIVSAFGTSGNIYAGIALAALAAATGAVQIGIITSQPTPEFAKGGIARGASHGNGGISMVNADGTKVGEMEGDEPYMILSRDSYRNNGHIIDALLDSSMNRGGAPINLAAVMGRQPRFDFGGVFNAMQKVKYATGGIFTGNVTANTDMLQMLSSINDKLSNPVRAEVVYQDITDRGSSLSRAQSRASFSKT